MCSYANLVVVLWSALKRLGEGHGVLERNCENTPAFSGILLARIKYEKWVLRGIEVCKEDGIVFGVIGCLSKATEIQSNYGA
jgi:hypothetical protein